ncbi:MAG TPA: nuclear transport factor 2 family protein [Acidisarcina sp.]
MPVVPLLALFLGWSSLHAQQDAGDRSKSEIIDTMQGIENSWGEALLKHDQFALEGVLAPSFVDISAEGEVTTRDQQIARLFLKDTDAISFQQKVASVRLFGDIALVNGTYILRYARDGRTIDDKGIFSQVFQRAHARWQCINSQRTFVVEQGAARRQSALPFHLPGTRSGAVAPKAASAPPAAEKGPQASPAPKNQP